MTMNLLGNGVVVTGWGGPDDPAPEILPAGAVAWDEGRIVAVGAADALQHSYPAAECLDAHGGLVIPGLVNLHHHFYSALARGLDPRTPMRNFTEVLDRLWWRLDRALDPETIGLSARLSAADCIRWGCTTVFDHHASPSYIDGSLDVIAEALETAGLRGVLCYEITDRNGSEQAERGLEENLRFLAARAEHPTVRGVMGLHASFTLRNRTLEQVAARRPANGGCHIHVAEDPVDVVTSKAEFGVEPVQRLAGFDLLDDRALLAHGIHLDPDAYELAAAHGATLIHNPESNANNGVGRLDVPETTAHGCRVGLGTDGMSSSVLRALRSAFLLHRAGRQDPDSGFDALPDLLGTNVRVARRFLGEPLLGRLTPGAPADLIAIDQPPPTPLTTENLFAHLVYGVPEAAVRHTIAGGAVLLRDFRHTTLDPAELAARAREATPALWDRFHANPWGTSFLG